MATPSITRTAIHLKVKGNSHFWIIHDKAEKGHIITFASMKKNDTWEGSIDKVFGERARVSGKFKNALLDDLRIDGETEIVSITITNTQTPPESSTKDGLEIILDE